MNPRSRRKHRTKNERVVLSIELKAPTSSMTLPVASSVSTLFDNFKREVVELNARIVVLNNVVPPSPVTNELAAVQTQIGVVEASLTNLNNILLFDSFGNLSASNVQALKEMLQGINDDSSSSIDEWKIDLNALKSYANEVLDSLESDLDFLSNGGGFVTIIEVTTCLEPEYKKERVITFRGKKNDKRTKPKAWQKEKIKSSKVHKKRQEVHDELLDDINEIVFEELR